MIRFLKYLLKTALFWLLFFAFFRLGFILFNLNYAAGTPATTLAQSFMVGLHLDLAMMGYVLLLLSVTQVVILLICRKFAYKLLHWINIFFVITFTALLLGNINLYAYWGRLLDAEGFSFLKTPWIIFASVRWYEPIIFLIVWIGLLWSLVKFYQWINHKEKASKKLSALSGGMAAFMVLFIGAVMIIPIRGGFGVAPINTGVAYFSSYNYANHAAINPLWNLFYSFKRMDARMRHYKFMGDAAALAVYEEMHNIKKDSSMMVLQTKHPNIVVILLESFSAQVVGCLGGEQITPNLDALAKEGILFSNIYAASDRSDKGLVATLAGYQVMPAYSIMQYPVKCQSLSFMPLMLKASGYSDFTYIYGGDIGFKGMNSFVTLAGFEKVITVKNFPISTKGEKWGVHDEYTFDRLEEEMKLSLAGHKPFFKFFFTLSSHEPFIVPMETVEDDPYLNSICYTDRCLGDFFKKVKEDGLWDNSLFILIADHGTPGPKRATSQMRDRYHIPMIWTGGALAVKDTIISTMGSQKDLVVTLLNQLAVNSDSFMFSKDLLNPNVKEYAFFTYPEAFGYITPLSYQVYDDVAKKYVMIQGEVTEQDSIRGKAYLQVLSADHLRR